MTETTTPSKDESRLLPFLVTAAVGGAGLLVVLALAFSTHNTEASVHGTTATTSHWVTPSK